MKTRVQLIYISALGLLLWASACSAPRYGSVSKQSVLEALAEPRLALTPHQPRWLLDKGQVLQLSASEVQMVRKLLSSGEVRLVPEVYYRDETQGNRGDDSTRLFYLYAGNGQCLGGRVQGQRVLMDDFDLPDSAQAELYALFCSKLAKLKVI